MNFDEILILASVVFHSILINVVEVRVHRRRQYEASTAVGPKRSALSLSLALSEE